MCFGASVLLRKASALKRIDVRYGPQNAHRLCIKKDCKVFPYSLIVNEF